jgi:hypothetical protein
MGSGTMAIHASSGPDIIRSWPSAGQEKIEGRCTGQAGGPPGARILLQVYLSTAEANEKGAPAWISKGSHEPAILNHFENGSDLWLTFSAPTRPPLPKVVKTGYTVLASTGSGHSRPVRLQSCCRSGE